MNPESTCSTLQMKCVFFRMLLITEFWSEGVVLEEMSADKIRMR